LTIRIIDAPISDNLRNPRAQLHAFKVLNTKLICPGNSKVTLDSFRIKGPRKNSWSWWMLPYGRTPQKWSAFAISIYVSVDGRNHSPRSGRSAGIVEEFYVSILVYLFIKVVNLAC